MRLQDKDKSLLDGSPVKIAKAPSKASVMVSPTVSKQKVGNLLDEVKLDSKHLKKCKEINGIPGTVEPHKHLNTSKGVVINYKLRGRTEEEFQDIDGVTCTPRYCM